jgi:hypothetical protein
MVSEFIQFWFKRAEVPHMPSPLVEGIEITDPEALVFDGGIDVMNKTHKIYIRLTEEMYPGIIADSNRISPSIFPEVSYE